MNLAKEVGFYKLNLLDGNTSISLRLNFSEGDKIYVTYSGPSYIKFIQYHDINNVEHTSERIDIHEGVVYEYTFPEDAKDVNFYFGNNDMGNYGIIQVDTSAIIVSKSYTDKTKEEIDGELDKIADSFIVLNWEDGSTSKLYESKFNAGDKVTFKYEGSSYIKFIQYHDKEGTEHTSERVDIHEDVAYEYTFPEDAVSVNVYFGDTAQNNKAILILTNAQNELYSLDKRVSNIEDELPADEVTLKTFSPQLDSLESNCYFGARTYGGSIEKCLQLAHISDTHGDYKALENAVILSKYPTVDATIHTGDYLVNAFATNVGKTEYLQIVNNTSKPILFVMGNHDVGDGNGVSFCGTHEQVYNTFIAPLQTKGFISANGNNYYYKDFSEVKARLIVLYEQDMPLDYDDTVWEHITYNAEYPIGVNGTSYNSGDCINIEGHTDASFRAVNNTTLDLTYGYNITTAPAYKINRGWRVFSKIQMEWLCNVLASTPAGYGVVIALHNFFSENISLITDKFTSKFANVNVTHNCMQTDILAEIVHAFVNRQYININVATKPNSAYGIGNNRAAYLNTQKDEQGNNYWYNLSASFNNVDSSVKFIAFIGGHTHFDAITRHNIYNELIQITETCTINVNLKNAGSSDIKTATDEKLLAYNCINVEGFDQTDMAIRLTKIGARYNVDGELRDFDKVAISN